MTDRGARAPRPELRPELKPQLKPHLHQVIRCPIMPNERPERTAFWPKPEGTLARELKDQQRAKRRAK